jgi:hypothetical protein
MNEVTRVETEYDSQGRVVGAHEVPADQPQQFTTCPACGTRRRMSVEV